jgi:hypothetical protein
VGYSISEPRTALAFRLASRIWDGDCRSASQRIQHHGYGNSELRTALAVGWHRESGTSMTALQPVELNFKGTTSSVSANEMCTPNQAL